MKRPDDSVKIKGVRGGFTLTIDGGEPYISIEKKTSELFTNLKKLAVGAKVAVDNSTGEEDNFLVEKLGLFLKERYGVAEVVPSLKKYDENTEPKLKDNLSSTENKKVTDRNGEMSNLKLMAGRVRSGQKVVAENHLVILGDVNPGAEVMAGGDILILGSLCGTAVAGQADNPDSIILAFDFRPSQVQIADIMAVGATDSKGKETEFAFIENGCIVVEKYGSSGPFGKLPVLTER